jgi:hypothetical protein
MFLKLPRLLVVSSLVLSCSVLGHKLLKKEEGISFQLLSGGNDNYFLRDSVTSGQLLLTNASNTLNDFSRLVVAFPAGNSGALVYFLPLGTDNKTLNAPSACSGGGSQRLSVSLVNGTLKSTQAEFSNAGVQADISFSGNTTLGVTIIGAVRAMRGMHTSQISMRIVTK